MKKIHSNIFENNAYFNCYFTQKKECKNVKNGKNDLKTFKLIDKKR